MSGRAVLGIATALCGVVLLALGFFEAPGYKVTGFGGLLAVIGIGALSVVAWLAFEVTVGAPVEAILSRLSDDTKRVVVYSLLALAALGAVLLVNLVGAP